jgi:branched-chain amino acid transport system ATP-binding protein
VTADALALEGIRAAYGRIEVLHDVDLTVPSGGVVALLGANGVGKSTLLKVASGALRPTSGRIVVQGKVVPGGDTRDLTRAGVCLVPEGRGVFPTLTVEENLVATAASRFGAPRWTIERVYDLFPRLKERSGNLGSQLSGGEQQMLAIGRALMTNPKLLILDEATEGLAPLIRAEIWSCLERLKGERHAIVVIDKNVDALTRFADRHVIIEKGRVVWTGTSAELRADPTVKDRYLHV